MELNKEYFYKIIGDDSIYSLNDLNLVIKLIELNNLSLIELDIMSRLRHQNLMQIIDFGIFETTKNTIKKVELTSINTYKFGFVMEKSKTNLKNYVPKSKQETLDIIEQIKQDLFYLHENNIIRGDIKLENILVFQNGNNINVKLTDFVLSKYTENLKTKDLIKNIENYKPLDYWALGVLIFRLITYDNLIFSNMTQNEINDTIITEFDCLDYAELIDFTKKCLSRNPKDRNVFIKSNSGYNISIYKNITIPDQKFRNIINFLTNLNTNIGYDILLKTLHFIIVNYEDEDGLEKAYNMITLFYTQYKDYIKLYNLLESCNGIINNYSLYDTTFRNIEKIESLNDYNFIFKYFLEK